MGLNKGAETDPAEALHRMAAPTLGQHTEEVLSTRLKLAPGRLAELRAKGVI